jgi:histidinol-phosphate aminotransferase
MNLEDLVRESIRTLKPYSCARDEFKGEASVYLDANESPFNIPYNRYPDPHQLELKAKISDIKEVPVEKIFLGNGSDEAIDLLYRIFCEPGVDNVVAIEPTYGMYKVSADLNGVTYRPTPLNDKFDIDAYKIMDFTNQHTKIIWLCSPNNPTGNNLKTAEIIKLLKWFRGLVVVDEAYIDFSGEESMSRFLPIFSNLVVLQTFSKAWASAGVRLGMAFAASEIIEFFNKVKYPYNVNILSQQYISNMLDNREQILEWVSRTITEREKLIRSLKKIDIVRQVHPSDANFVLVEVDDANYVYNILVEKGVIVRNRSNISLCKDCLRITVGTPDENADLLKEMKLIQ